MAVDDFPGEGAPASDPRTSGGPGTQHDVRPIVERPARGLSGVAIGSIAALAGIGLFATLEARRYSATAPAAVPRRDVAAGSLAPPPLYVPPAPPSAVAALPVAPPQSAALPLPNLERSQPIAPSGSAPVTVATSIPSGPSYSSPAPSAVQQRPPRNVGGQALIADLSIPSDRSESPTSSDGDDNNTGTKRAGLSTTRARAAMLANRSTTVPQGTLIPAVLETGFDSTSPGFARALVQKDVHGFDGTRVLIPRGSRLIGEYGADIAQGQKRAVILWVRLIRPDGVTIAIGSPAADTIGRGGVKADVNTHFLERFSGAILQSALDVGVNFAARNSRSPVIVALPGTTSAVTNAVSSRATEITPTLRVPAGRSVSVFVARDLDFTSAEALR